MPFSSLVPIARDDLVRNAWNHSVASDRIDIQIVWLEIAGSMAGVLDMNGNGRALNSHTPGIVVAAASAIELPLQMTTKESRPGACFRARVNRFGNPRAGRKSIETPSSKGENEYVNNCRSIIHSRRT